MIFFPKIYTDWNKYCLNVTIEWKDIEAQTDKKPLPGCDTPHNQDRSIWAEKGVSEVPIWNRWNQANQTREPLELQCDMERTELSLDHPYIEVYILSRSYRLVKRLA